MSKAAALLMFAGLGVVTIFCVSLIAKNKRLAIGKKMLWAGVMVFLPLIGSVICLKKKGAAGA